MSNALVESYPAVPEAIGRARRAVQDFACLCGARDDAAKRVALAVSEACTNVVLHAYLEHEQPGEFHVAAEIVEDDGDGALRVTVTDDGRGMRPHLDSPGAGLGMPIIAQTADVFEVRSRAAGGTELCMRFRIRFNGSDY
jgi:anti-sigma regulatory factor (Ser/Thr protein kinase)